MPYPHRSYRIRSLTRRLLAGAALALFPFSLSAADNAPAEAMLGTWQFDASRSTDLSPWQTSRLVLALDGDRLTVERELRWGRRAHQEAMTLDLARDTNTVPLDWWVDNRHLGAYAPHDGTRTISVRALDAGRVLRLDMDFTLETQQGDRAVNVLRQYQLSPDGQVLTVTDLRSTRPRPVVHVYTRVTE